METKKSYEFIKVMAASLLCIGVFIVGFLGISNMVLGAAFDGTEIIPTEMPMFYLHEDNVLPDGFQPPMLTVGGEDWSNPNVNAMSREEAAEIGALYIWEVFGESIDGKYVRMLNGNRPMTRDYWIGTVHSEEFTLPFGLHSFVGVEITEEMVNEMMEMGNWSAPPELFRFTIDAVTGERLSIVRYESDSADLPLMRELSQDEDNRVVMGRLFDTVEPPENIEAFEQAAKVYAQRHFTRTQVESVALEVVTPAPGGFGVDDSGNIYVGWRHIILLITDNTGREAFVIIHEADGLFSIDTMHNDFIPGIH